MPTDVKMTHIPLPLILSRSIPFSLYLSLSFSLSIYFSLLFSLSLAQVVSAALGDNRLELLPLLQLPREIHAPAFGLQGYLTDSFGVLGLGFGLYRGTSPIRKRPPP